MDNVQKVLKKINISCPIRFNEPLRLHTSFAVGGPASVFALPSTLAEVKEVYSACVKHDLPLYVLGAGANILVSDKGIRAVVVSLDRFCGIEVEHTRIHARGGTALNAVVQAALECSLSGADPFYKMPGSVGGAIWMNARCYNTSISDILETVEILDDSLESKRIKVTVSDFGYKKSPFQHRRLVIVGGTFNLKPADRAQIKKRMDEIYRDRLNKGHFAYPCAGSVFKNNREFGLPSGKLIDSLGLKGYTIGGAQVSPRHANIIVNTGSATAGEVRELIAYLERRVYEHYGFRLEREIIYVGEN
jgi:UDP-N-acetylmuramate dehydrogenase